MQTFLQDLRYALLQLRRAPGYALTAILTLAVGIGANAAIFTLIDDTMLRSLPVARPAELVTVGFKVQKMLQVSPIQSLAGLEVLRRQLKSVEGLSGWSPDMLSVADEQGTLRSIACEMVSGGALSMLGVHPYLGRLLTPADDVPGGPEGGWPAVLGYGFWQANYHGDPAIVGRHITVSGHVATVVGVLPADYQGVFVGMGEKVLLPMHFLSVKAPRPDLDAYKAPENSEVMVLGRLRPGATVGQLNAELATVSAAQVRMLLPTRLRSIPDFHDARLAAEGESRGFGWLGQEYRQPLLILEGIVGLVLLLCCVNLASVQFARVQSRQHEFAVRAAIGAGRMRILRQCLTESLLLSAAGSLIAGGLAWASTGALGAYLTPPGAAEPTLLRPDGRVFLLSALLALLTTLVFGLAPGWMAGRTPPATLLKAGGSNRRSNQLRQRIFVPAQFALALVLVFGAGLFAQTLIRLRSNHAGFEPRHLTMVTAQFQELKGSPAEITALYGRMVETLRGSPGVEAAAYTWVTPLTGFAPELTVHALAHSHDDHPVKFNEVGEGYFHTMGTALLAGREFTADEHSRTVCVLNQAAARLLFANSANAVGDSIKAVNGRGPKLEATCRILGIVEDARYASLREPAPPTLYFPLGPEAMAIGGYTNNMVFMIRSGTVAEATTAYRAALARYAPQTGYMAFLPLSDQVDQSLGSERLIATLSSTFALIALLLSAIGLFGVLALRVHQRTAELGIRLALGASREQLLGMVLREAMSMAAVGALAGVVLAAAGSALIRRFLYGVSPTSVGVAAASLGALLLVALVAAWLPASRAASIDPMQALRTE